MYAYKVHISLDGTRRGTLYCRTLDDATAYARDYEAEGYTVEILPC